MTNLIPTAYQIMMNFRFRHVVLITAVLYTGCVTSSPVPPASLPAPTPETIPEGPKTVSPELSWKITPISQNQTYSTVVTTTVTDVDSPATRDSLTTEISYSIKMLPDFDGLSFTGSIAGFSVKRTKQQQDEAPLSLPVTFSGKLGNHVISFQTASSQGANSNICTDSSQAPLATIQRNIFLVPRELTNQQSWRDSTSSTICSGGLPLTITSIRDFRVVGESQVNGLSALILDQNERTFSKGEGSQGQHRIFVDGEGVTAGRIYVDSGSGQLLATSLTNKTSLAVQSSGRIQHFLQNSTEVTQKVR